MNNNFGLSMAVSHPPVVSDVVSHLSPDKVATLPPEMCPGFWDCLYQLQMNYRLCDIQLCIRDVTVSGELPISHCIPVHKLVVVGSSLFFRRCLDNGELLDMYNFDGVQPQNLQLLVDYMYHQVPWESVMANDEASEVARILEIVRHEAVLPAPRSGDEKKVLIVQMQDRNQKQLDQECLSQVRQVVTQGKVSESPNTKNLKKGTRVLIQNLEEELKKHNIGRKKVIVLESQFAQDLPHSLKTEERTPVSTSAVQIAGGTELAIQQADDHNQNASSELVVDVSNIVEKPRVENTASSVPDNIVTSASEETEQATEILPPGAILVNESDGTNDAEMELSEAQADQIVEVIPRAEIPEDEVSFVDVNIQLTEGGTVNILHPNNADSPENDDTQHGEAQTVDLTLNVDKKSSAIDTIDTKSSAQADDSGAEAVPQSPYSTRFKGKKRVVESMSGHQVKRRKGQETNEENLSELPAEEAPGTNEIEQSFEQSTEHAGVESTSEDKQTEEGEEFEVEESNESEIVSAGSTTDTAKIKKRLATVVRNVKKATEAEAPFTCLTCHKRFKNQTGLNIHEQWKHSKKPGDGKREGQHNHECQTCQKMCASYQALVQHMRVKHLTTPTHQCDDCGQYFSTLRQFKSHRIKEHGDVMFKCDICDISFKSPEGHKIHMFKQHAQVDNSHVCNVCGKSFKMKHELTAHLRITHASTRAFQCQLCERDFKSKSSLKRHLETFHTDVKKFACSECSLMFKTRADMQAHCKKHFRADKPLLPRADGDEEFHCDRCDKIFKKLYQFQAHMRNVHADQDAGFSYVCTMCKKTYSAKNYLLQHIRQIHLPKRHKCPQCLYEFTYAYMLRKHMPKCKGYPIGNKPYRCSRCHRSFNLKGNLTRHIRSTSRCRGATRDNFPDYIVVLSSDTKRGVVEGRISNTKPQASVTDVEAIQASEALQQLQASGSQDQIICEEELLNTEGGVMIREDDLEEELILEDTGEVVVDPSAYDHVKQEDLVEDIESLKDVLALPEGVKARSIQRDQYGNVVIEVSNDHEGGDFIAEAGEPVEESPDLIRTSTGEILIGNTTAEGETYLVQDIVQDSTGQDVQVEGSQLAPGTQVYQIVNGDTIQELVQTTQLEGDIQVIQKNGTIQLVHPGGETVQVLGTQEDNQTQLFIKEEA